MFYNSNNLDKIYKVLGVKLPQDIEDIDSLIINEKEKLPSVPLITHLINEGNISILYGHASIGKTYFISSLAKAVSLGLPLTDYFSIPRAHSVLTVVSETNDAVSNSKSSCCNKMYPERATDTFAASGKVTYKLDTAQGQKQLESLIERVNNAHPGKRPISVIILDSLKKLTNAGDMPSGWDNLFNFMDSLRIQRGYTWIVVHHVTKENKMFGSNSLLISVENVLKCHRDTEEIQDSDPLDLFEAKKDKYPPWLLENVETWRKQYCPNDIWFYLTWDKGRDFTPCEKRVALLHMNPDDDKPVWKRIDFTKPEHQWSRHTWHESTKYRGLNKNSGNSYCEDNPSEAYDSKPTYEMLKKSKSRDFILYWLRAAYKAGNHTREQMGQFFGLAAGKGKDATDYLCNKHSCTNECHITEEEYRSDVNMPESAEIAEK